MPALRLGSACRAARAVLPSGGGQDTLRRSGEARDLAAAMPDKVKELQGRWDAWNATLVPALWGNGKTDSDGAEPGAPAKEKRRKGAL